jgi:hypothetical protein
MSYYRNKLQEALLQSRLSTHNSPTRNRFYAVCETAAEALFLGGWIVAIVSHL